MLFPLRQVLTILVFGGLVAVSAAAQEPPPPTTAPPDTAQPTADAAPANVEYVEGDVDVVQDGATERADPPVMLLPGDIVRTRNGRAEVVFTDGTLLYVSHDTEVEWLTADRLRLTRGRVLVRFSAAALGPYLVDTRASSVRLESEGEYDLTTNEDGRLTVSVARGSATVGEGTARPVTVTTGLRVTLMGPGGRPLVESYNTAEWDAFADWARSRTGMLASSGSAAQLPYELRPYGPMFDQYGQWNYLAPYGYVWYPSVAVSWRPYFVGSWKFTRFGWTWHGRDRFAWPTHHFGRWGFHSGAWFWIPGTQWGPAWVSWSVTAGLVGWAPLGWDGRPAIGFVTGRDHPAYRPNYSPWRAWTVIPRRHFRPHVDPRTHAVDGERLDVRSRRALAADVAVPVRPGPDRAVVRDRVTRDGVPGNVRRPRAVLPPNAVPDLPSLDQRRPSFDSRRDLRRPRAILPPRAVPRLPALRDPRNDVRRPREVLPPSPVPRLPVLRQPRGFDSPAYTPPPSWNPGASRPGSFRAPSGQWNTPGVHPGSRPGGYGAVPRGAAPAGVNPGGPPSAAPRAPGGSGGVINRGAVPRGGSSSPSSGASSSGASSSGAPAHGSARRPPSSR